MALSNGAKESDRTTLNNKSEAAQFYTDNVPIDNYTEASSIAAVNTVDNTRTSVDASKARTLALAEPTTKIQTLTSNVESLEGTLKSDTFSAVASDLASANDTFNLGDTIDGSGGTDSFNLAVTGTNNSNTLAAADVKNIEVIKLKALLSEVTANTTLKAINFAGANAFYADHSTSAITFSGVTNGKLVGIESNGNLVDGDLTINYTDSASYTVISLNGGVQKSAITQTGAGITSTEIRSSGTSVNSLNGITLSGNANKKLIIKAEAVLTTGGITGFGANNSEIIISGGAMNLSGKPSYSTTAVKLSELDSKVTKVDAVFLSEGGIGVLLNSNTDLKVTGGAGNDFVVSGSVLTSGQVNAGGGSGDILQIRNATHLTNASLGAKYTNFETLSIYNDVNIDMDHISGITNFKSMTPIAITLALVT